MKSSNNYFLSMSFTLYFKLLGYLMSSLVEFNIFFRDREKSPTPDSAVELDPLPIETVYCRGEGQILLMVTFV